MNSINAHSKYVYDFTYSYVYVCVLYVRVCFWCPLDVSYEYIFWWFWSKFSSLVMLIFYVHICAHQISLAEQVNRLQSFRLTGFPFLMTT